MSQTVAQANRIGLLRISQYRGGLPPSVVTGILEYGNDMSTYSTDLKTVYQR